MFGDGPTCGGGKSLDAIAATLGFGRSSVNRALLTVLRR